MSEWYLPNELPQANVLVLAYCGNAPVILYVEHDGNWHYAWDKKRVQKLPECWRYLPPRPKTLNTVADQ